MSVCGGGDEVRNEGRKEGWSEGAGGRKEGRGAERGGGGSLISCIAVDPLIPILPGQPLHPLFGDILRAWNYS